MTGAEPVLPSSRSRIGTAAQATVAASALAANELWHLRTGRRQRVSVDMRHAGIEFRSERYLRLDGKPPPEHRDKTVGLYRTGDGRWIRLHTNLPHHRAGTLKLLGADYDRASVQRAIDGWQAFELEDAAAKAGLSRPATRSFAEWDAHPQGRAVAAQPLFSIEKIGEAPAEPLPPGERPVSGVKVLDLTRVIAGPVCGRTLAAHGADVLNITAAHLAADAGARHRHQPRQALGAARPARIRRPSPPRQLATRLGRTSSSRATGRAPSPSTGSCPRKSSAARLRPGIVYVSLCAYGHEGPWAGRRGFDSLVQNANGLNVAEAEAAGEDKPRPLPCQELDHATGYLMALGAMTALHRRATEGGSWHVRCSLAQTGHWFRHLGRVEGGLALSRPETRRRARLHGERAVGLRSPHRRAPFRRDVGNAGALERPSVPLCSTAGLGGVKLPIIFKTVAKPI